MKKTLTGYVNNIITNTLQNIDKSQQLQTNLIKNRVKVSSSSSSEPSIAIRISIRYSYGITPDEIPVEGEDSVIKFHIWNNFKEILDEVETKEAQIRQETRKNRAAGLPTVKNLPI
jgi:hypothetical protein